MKRRQAVVSGTGDERSASFVARARLRQPVLEAEANSSREQERQDEYEKLFPVKRVVSGEKQKRYDWNVMDFEGFGSPEKQVWHEYAYALKAFNILERPQFLRAEVAQPG